jgi:class 3 adenylate cyclase
VEGDAERRLAAVLHADVAGYSRLMAADEDATVRALLSFLAGLPAA